MLSIDKNKPIFFDNLVKNKTTWSELKDREKLNNSLLDDQNQMCAYCESKVKNYHIDHYKKRDLFPNLTFDYNNLFISCNCEHHSAKFKDKFGLKKENFDDFYSPSDIKSNEFDYSLTGEVLGKTPKAKKTIEVFNLNHRSLVEKRKKISLNSEYCLEFNFFDMFQEFETFLAFLEKYYQEER